MTLRQTVTLLRTVQFVENLAKTPEASGLVIFMDCGSNNTFLSTTAYMTIQIFGLYRDNNNKSMFFPLVLTTKMTSSLVLRLDAYS